MNVVDQPVAATCENRRPIDKTHLLPMAAVGGEPSHSAPVWKHTTANGGFVTSRPIMACGGKAKLICQWKQVGEEVSEKPPDYKAITVLYP